ncbi:tRNA (cytidine(34)-2'-O)-methyltransferase [Breoghania corrubedonensis]|nr:tRNA (cytidine(34)-2'-O)-methyltransferase [Breoghania corrubedonensis]
MPDIALFQPDIPQNTGTILRMAACLGLTVHLIEPAGFALSDRNFRRAGLDYLDQAAMRRHVDWSAFRDWQTKTGRRLLLLTTKADIVYTDFSFREDDILLLGRESAGAPPEVHAGADARLKIAMRPQTRSLNIALAAAMITGEALRQTDQFP